MDDATLSFGIKGMFGKSYGVHASYTVRQPVVLYVLSAGLFAISISLLVFFDKAWFMFFLLPAMTGLMLFVMAAGWRIEVYGYRFVMVYFFFLRNDFLFQDVSWAKDGNGSYLVMHDGARVTVVMDSFDCYDLFARDLERYSKQA